MLSRIRSERGFTLIELMVVILIIGILVAIAVPVFSAARENAYRRTCQSNLRTLDGAVQNFKANDASELWPANLVALVNGNYIKENPTCPKANQNYWYGPSTTTGGVGYTLTATERQQSSSPVIQCPGKAAGTQGYENHVYP